MEMGEFLSKYFNVNIVFIEGTWRKQLLIQDNHFNSEYVFIYCTPNHFEVIRFGGKALLRLSDIPEYVKLVMYEKEKVEEMWKNEEKEDEKYIHPITIKNHDFTLRNYATIGAFKRLRVGEQLNDVILDAHLLLLQKRDSENVIVLSSFFFAKHGNEPFEERIERLLRWRKKTKVCEKKKIFFPINMAGCHWALFVVFLQKDKGEIQYFDSLFERTVPKLEEEMDLLDNWITRKVSKHFTNNITHISLFIDIVL
jgi:Ulp1 family protease